ncbi:Fe-only nitrogenase accessory protein AnfO [Pseudothauera nasutitermitis]|uniref:Fe-only nitrogenase accessory protein AnfO n=1 Tax=Pseudothauera nasutitermitis TaxID=2565930 RepID=A0A4S4B0C3_9RHOO|nr:Fe-only nitrogenase accessory protein AnfO [Pseudothauera nasutitermitis]THF65929.1 Fe-only nitrogenase accessory protein AnfO [Pseudothauera nasutitermitis]
MKITAHVNARGEPASLYEPGRLRLYEQTEENGRQGWRVLHDVALEISEDMPLQAVKAALHGAAAHMEDSKVLLSGSVRGMPYSVFQEELGYRIWKSEGPLLAQLDTVARKEAEQAASKRYDIVALASRPVPAPVQLSDAEPGCFWIDLAEALKYVPTPTSRQILIPFLERGQFRKLEIVCDHIPKWMAWEMERLDLSAESEAVDSSGVGVKVTVYTRHTPEGRARKAGLLGAGPALCLPCPRDRERRRLPAADRVEVADWQPVGVPGKG